ncbi:DUF5679 domain-containing protein [Herpetosiphon giganteus]|uniref:DUF5679 domain-containing protein n=1 Tax=Herpetosiphon giganteus TaxID=2029754 RepID=UPI0019592A40|nr:DUF5679 domain-containing protein [Herpetosiphon giganteus]MBM7844834.1 hypothetical protein [Herpetosiphon giganteus]
MGNQPKSKRRLWVSLLLGLAAVVVIVRRKLQPIDSAPILPPPPPPPSDPPRIVLPTDILTTEIATSAPEIEADPVTIEPEPVADEAPLLEREVGGNDAASVETTEPVAEAEAPAEDDDDEDELRSYCVSCRAKQPMIDAHEELTENGRRALRGTCEVCGAGMFRFLPNKD